LPLVPLGDTRLVFLSYSRRDIGIVRKLQAIVWAAGARPWRDDERLEPGAQWRIAIATAIDACERILVFWCCHARKSVEVRGEYLRAIAQQKIVVPVMLDGTPMAEELCRYHATDVSGLVRWHHELLVVERWMWISGLTVLMLAAISYALR
jgi:hypothetical protein